jgi:vacuolar-type H+-ATPase subunit I/STV1
MNEESTEYISPEHEYVSVPPRGEKSRAWVIVSALLLLLIITGVVFAVISMVNNPDQTETIRDIVIIFMAVESLLIGLVLIILIIQLARLTTMLQNEVKPILDSTNETLNTLRGTTNFLSNKLVNPVVKANSSIAAIMRAIELLGFGRFRKR